MFNGKTTYDAGPTLPELADDVGDLVSIIGPHETPLLDHLGSPRAAARSTVHEWLEDVLLPNTDIIVETDFDPDPTTANRFAVEHPSRFQEGDLLRPGDTFEVMRVIRVLGTDIDVERGYGSTPRAALSTGMTLHIVSNAAVEGADAPEARFTTRVRRQNWTQIFTATVSVSGTMQAANTIGVTDELEYQKAERLRELMRDLENAVINGVASSTNPMGADEQARSMNGIVQQIITNRFIPGIGDIPPGEDGRLTEEVLNAALREVWEHAGPGIDTIVCGGMQKRRLNAFASASRAYIPEDTRFRDMINVYESDFGVCRVVMSRYVPNDVVLLLDSTRLDVMPLAGRSFHYKPLAATGDSTSGQVIGEYTLECRNESAHALIKGLA